jgi:hypothetical protein
VSHTSRCNRTDNEIPMRSKLLWAMAILVPTLLAGFAIGLMLDFNKSDRQSAVTTPTIRSTESKNLEAPNIRSDDASKQVTQWKVYLNGFGPIKVGMSPREASQAIGKSLVGYGHITGNECYFIHPEKEPKGVDFMIIGGRVARIDVKTPEITTISGARVGHTEDQIKAIYPEQLTAEPHKYLEEGHYLTFIPNDPHYSQFRLVFETDGKVVTTYRAGKLPEVEFVERCG